MTRPRTRLVLPVLLASAFLLSALAARADDDDFRYREGRADGAELKYVEGVPVLLLAGSPDQLGRQQGTLGSGVAERLASYPVELLRMLRREDGWPRHLKLSQEMVKQFPPHHLAELDALARAAGVERDMLVAVNTMTDAYRGGLGCSSLMVDAGRSKTGGPLFGRNLDFYTLGELQKYSLVLAYRPQGKRAFVSVGFPGFIGCLSGMNDAGLALAVHESYASRDGSPLFDPKGVPYALCFRRILEECATVEEAEKLLRSVKRTTLLNLAVCDRKTHAVLELTPRNVAVRHGENGVCACTNHFRTEALKFITSCPRYDRLIRAGAMDRLGVEDVAAKLHEVHQGRATLQTMIFEPGPLRLHLAIGACPTTALPLKKLELAPLLAAPQPGGK